MLSSDSVARGDALYDDAVSVTLETGDLGGPAVVTGAVPVVGAEVAAGGVILEVTGRPVIVLPGLPTTIVADAVISQMCRRASSPGFESWWRRVESVGYCAHPI